nr:MAG TPA: hypothetical protein [Caudoviricetes sp.]
MTTTASSRPAPRAAPMMPPPCTACTRSPRHQHAPPALHQRAASSRPAARRPRPRLLHLPRLHHHDGQQISAAAALQGPPPEGSDSPPNGI